MSRWLFALLILSMSYGHAQYYDDDYEDDYYGSPFNPPGGGQPQNGSNPQSQRPMGAGAAAKSASDMAGQDLQADTGRMIPSEQGSVKFKVVEGEFWEPKKKRRAARQ